MFLQKKIVNLTMSVKIINYVYSSLNKVVGKRQAIGKTQMPNLEFGFCHLTFFIASCLSPAYSPPYSLTKTSE